jgi:hypothetical protein
MLRSCMAYGGPELFDRQTSMLRKQLLCNVYVIKSLTSDCKDYISQTPVAMILPGCVLNPSHINFVDLNHPVQPQSK